MPFELAPARRSRDDQGMRAIGLAMWWRCWRAMRVRARAATARHPTRLTCAERSTAEPVAAPASERAAGGRQRRISGGAGRRHGGRRRARGRRRHDRRPRQWHRWSRCRRTGHSVLRLTSGTRSVSAVASSNLPRGSSSAARRRTGTRVLSARASRRGSNAGRARRASCASSAAPNAVSVGEIGRA